MRVLFKKELKSNSVISVVGLAKNTGKTTTLNKLIEEAKSIYKSIGVISTGRDGERVDVFTGKAKPRIFVPAGSVFVTTEESLVMCEAPWKLLKKTRYSTSMGRVLILKALMPGFVEVSGPVSVNETIEIVKLLGKDYKAARVFVDGSINRTAIITSRLKCGVVLATGAVLGDLSEIIKETLLKITMLTLPVVDGKIKKQILRKNNCGTISFNKRKEANVLPESLLNYIENINKGLFDRPAYIYTSGAITDLIMEALLKKKLVVELIALDALKIHVSRSAFEKWKNNGGSFKVVNKINLVAITCNPYNPMGTSYEPKRFVKAIKKYSLKIPVYDVVQGS